MLGIRDAPAPSGPGTYAFYHTLPPEISGLEKGATITPLLRPGINFSAHLETMSNLPLRAR